MKWITIVIGVVVCSVAFLYYLLTNENFIPFNRAGEYNWLNISILVFFITLIFSLIILLFSIAILSILKKGMRMRRKAFISVEIALFSGLGVLAIITLNFFHILDLTWGMGILGIAIMLLFIILFPHDKKEEKD